MNLRRRQQPAPARTETAERSLDPSLQNRVRAQARRIQQLIGEASHYEVEAANLRLDLKQADATIARQIQEQAELAGRIADLEQVVEMLGNAANLTRQQHEAELASKQMMIDSRNQQIERLIDHPGLGDLINQTRRPPLTATPDAEPTGAVPLATGGLITGPTAVVGEAGCDLYMSPRGSLWPHGAWQSAPRAGEDR